MTHLSLRHTWRGLAAGLMTGFCLSTAQAGEIVAAPARFIGEAV